MLSSIMHKQAKKSINVVFFLDRIFHGDKINYGYIPIIYIKLCQGRASEDILDFVQMLLILSQEVYP